MSHRVNSILNHLSPSSSSPSSSSSSLVSNVVGGQSSSSSSSSSPSSKFGSKAAVKVVISGAAGQIAYSLIFMIAQGHMLGPDTPVDLRLLEIPVAANALKGVIMELQDCAYPLVRNVIGTTDYKTAFEDVEIAFLVGAKPRGPGMQRRDLLVANAAIFKGQGAALNQYANRHVKVLVVGNPANTNALIAQQNAPDLPASAFTAMTRLDQNRAKSAIASRLNIRVSDVLNVIIWGNHSKTQYPDVNHAVINNYPQSHSSTPLRAAVNDNAWLDGEFLSGVQDRGAAIIQVRQKSSAASAASAAVDHIRDWVLGTREGEWVSMGVVSDGSYGVAKGIVFSFPCTCNNGHWNIVQGLKFDAFSKNKIDATTNELIEEKKEAGL